MTFHFFFDSDLLSLEVDQVSGNTTGKTRTTGMSLWWGGWEGREGVTEGVTEGVHRRVTELPGRYWSLHLGMLSRKLVQTARCRWGTPGPSVVESFRGDWKGCALREGAMFLSVTAWWSALWGDSVGEEEVPHLWDRCRVDEHFLASIRNEEGGGDQLWIEHSMTWSQTATDEWKLGNPDIGILLKSAVKCSSGGGFEMEVDSGSHRKLNVFFPLAFTLNLSHFSFETRTVWKGISFFPDDLSLILRKQQLGPY